MATQGSGTNQIKTSGAQLTHGHVIRESLLRRISGKVGTVGEYLERTGEKIEDRGFERIGDVVARIGSRIAHLSESRTADEESSSFANYSSSSNDPSSSYLNTHVNQDSESLGQKNDKSAAV